MRRVKERAELLQRLFGQVALRRLRTHADFAELEYAQGLGEDVFGALVELEVRCFNCATRVSVQR